MRSQEARTGALEVFPLVNKMVPLLSGFSYREIDLLLGQPPHLSKVLSDSTGAISC
jgi:hypothetical protein